MEDTDLFLVNRPGELKTYKQEKGDLMAKLQDSDLLLVNRDDTTYKITGAELKDSIKPDAIFPDGSQMLINPAPLSGTGTSSDPYILRTVVAAPAGISVNTVETITFYGEEEEAPVEWTASPASHFRQPVAKIDSNGEWSGQLSYTDDPPSTEDQLYTGHLQIGSVYFEWKVDQYVEATVAPEISSVSLTRSRQGSAGNRFTDCDFLVEATMAEDGNPASAKTFITEFIGITTLYQYTGPVTAYDDTTNQIDFSDPAPEGFDNFSEGDSIKSLEKTINYGTAVSITPRSINPGYDYKMEYGPTGYTGGSRTVNRTGTWTVPEGAFYASIYAVGGGGGSDGWAEWSGSSSSIKAFGGGGGGGMAYINNVAVTPGDTINWTAGGIGGSVNDGQDQGGSSTRDGQQSQVSGTGFNIIGYGGQTSGYSSTSGGSGGNYNVVSGSSGAGAVYTGHGGGSGGPGGSGTSGSFTYNSSTYYGSWGGGGGGAGGHGCNGGVGGNGVRSSEPKWGGSGGGFSPFGSLSNTGGIGNGGDNNCGGGSGGGGGGSTTNGNDGAAGSPSSGIGGGAEGGGNTTYIENGDPGGCGVFFSANGDRDLAQRININYDKASYEYDIEFGATFTTIAYSLKTNDYIKQGNNSAQVTAINGNVVTVKSSSPITWDAGSDFFNQYGEATGTIGSISNTAGAVHFVLSSTNDKWVPGNTVQSPNAVNPDGTTVVYGTMDSDGVTCNGLSLTATAYDFAPSQTATSMTLTFPATWDTGNAPDDEIPNGTTMKVQVTATNLEGSSVQSSDTIQRSADVITFNADQTIDHISDADNAQLKLNAATYAVRATAERKAALDAALLAQGFTQQQLDDTYAS